MGVFHGVWLLQVSEVSLVGLVLLLPLLIMRCLLPLVVEFDDILHSFRLDIFLNGVEVLPVQCNAAFEHCDLEGTPPL